ncbi:MAG: DUF58 domain-containing protein [Deltaproteobacteria bacterium]|nr:DUF58 domain-containing protein [Deltaproteobacteria bacterium]
MPERHPSLPPLFTAQFLARLETLRVRTRRRFLGSRPGGHLSPRRGAGLEFADYRPYTPGDDPRSIDWKLYSRTDRPYIKLFQEEEELYTYLFLDLSASMGYPIHGGKETAARTLALALAYVVLTNDDAVQLHVLNGEASGNATPFFRGRPRLFDLATFLHQRQTQGKVDPPLALAQHLRTAHRPGKAIWISDFLFPLETAQAGLHLLRSADFDIAVIQVLSPEELDPPLIPAGARMVDSESRAAALVRFDAQAKKEYLRRFDLHNRGLRSSCHQTGVHYAQFVTDHDLQHFILRELPALRILT